MTNPKLLRAQILRKAFDRAQRTNPAFSLRALARKLALSPSFVSRVLQGKIELPFARVADFVNFLKIDKISENRLLKTYADQRTLEILRVTGAGGKHDDIMNEYVELEEKHFTLLTKWYYIAILDLAANPAFQCEPAWVAKRLEMPLEETKRALAFLQSGKFLVQNKEGRWLKSAKNIRFPTKESRDLIRNYHELMMKKAISHLQTKKQQRDFERRLIAGISMAANPANYAAALARLNEAVYEIGKILSAGECTQVYHLGFQLFPLSTLAADKT